MSTTTDAATAKGGLFAFADQWTDMDRWHREVEQIRRETPVLPVELEGFEHFWVLTRHTDVFAVSRDNAHWLTPPAPSSAPRRTGAGCSMPGSRRRAPSSTSTAPPTATTAR